MPSVMAIISKAQFEDEFPDAAVGDVLPISEYRSVHKSLDKLAKDDALLLVTVRPGDERLWLVGVLERPKKGKTAWKATPNRQPVRDLSAVREQLTFDNGKGLSAKKGALGMSLQTPRALADSDVALLLGDAVPSFTREQLQLETWRTMSRADRDMVVASIAAAKGLEVVAHENGPGQARVRFRHPSGIELGLVPGGRFKMGLNEDEQTRLLAFLREEEDATGAIEMLENPDPLRPVHDVDVAPFLLAVTTSDDDFDADELSTVTKKLGKLGLRLPSEAEWEYACRGGFDGAFAHGDEIPSSTSPDPNGFGLFAMGSQMEVCADGYHPSYKGAPTTSEPWKGKGRVTRGGAEPLCWDGDRVWMLTLAAARKPFDPDDVCVSARPALSLFADHKAETPVRMLPAKRVYRAKVKSEPTKRQPVATNAGRIELVANPTDVPEAELFQRVLARPSDHAARIAYAHALFARGDARGEYLLAREAGDRARAAGLLAQHLPTWVAPIRKLGTDKIRRATFRDGFVDEIDIDTVDAKTIDAIAELTPLRTIEVTGDKVSLRKLAPLLAEHHVDELGPTDASANDLVAMLSTPGIALRALTFGSLAADDIARVLKTRGASSIEKLSIQGDSLNAAAAQALAALPLSELSLRFTVIDEAAFVALARMSSLRTLRVRSDEPFPEDGCRALGKLASALHTLSVNDALPVDVIAALMTANPGLEDVTLPTLEKRKLAPIVAALKAPRKLTFELGSNYEDVGSDGAKLLLKAAWPSLESLDLSSCGLGDDGAKAIAEWPETLAALDLGNNRITAKGAEAMGKAKGLRGLRSLRIVMNPIGSGGATALAAAKFAPELRLLDLFSNRIGAPGLRSLVGAMPKLESLKLGNENSYRDEGLKLAAQGALPNVRDLSVDEISTGALETWLASGHAANLEQLYIGNSTLSARAAEALVSLPRLSDVKTNFVLPEKPGAMEPIYERWWVSLTVSRLP